MSFVIFRHHNQAAGGFVQTMHDSRPQLATDPGKQGKAMQQGIDQSAAVSLIFR